MRAGHTHTDTYTHAQALIHIQKRNATLYQNLINATAIKHASFTVAAAAAAAATDATPSAEAATSTHAASTDLSTLFKGARAVDCECLGERKRAPATAS